MAEANELSLEEALAADIDAAFAEQAAATADVEQEVEKYVRDESGRFTKKQAEETAAEAVAPEAPVEAIAPEAPAKSWRPLWHKNEMGEWEQLPEPLRKAIEQREREAMEGIQKHSTAAKAWEPINELVKPFEQQLRMSGQTPQQFVGGLVNIYTELQQDPVKALNWLAEQTLGAGWNIPALAQWMQQNQYQAQEVDPLQQELQTLKKQLEELREAPVRQQREATAKVVTEWAKDKPYYSDLEPYMMGLIQADPSIREQFRVNAPATLDRLYEAAQYAHPALRERILEDQRKREVAAARVRGAQSPRGTPDEGAQPRKQQGKRRKVEDDLREAFDEAGI